MDANTRDCTRRKSRREDERGTTARNLGCVSNAGLLVLSLPFPFEFSFPLSSLLFFRLFLAPFRLFASSTRPFFLSPCLSLGHRTTFPFKPLDSGYPTMPITNPWILPRAYEALFSFYSSPPSGRVSCRRPFGPVAASCRRTRGINSRVQPWLLPLDH